MAKPTRIKPEPVSVCGVCIDCNAKPQRKNGNGGFKPRCRTCDRARYKSLTTPPHPTQGKFLGAEMSERIRIMLLSGERTESTARKLGVCLRTIQNYRKQFGISLRECDFASLNMFADERGSTIDYAPQMLAFADGQMVAAVVPEEF